MYSYCPWKKHYEGLICNCIVLDLIFSAVISEYRFMLNNITHTERCESLIYLISSWHVIKPAFYRPNWPCLFDWFFFHWFSHASIPFSGGIAINMDFWSQDLTFNLMPLGNLIFPDGIQLQNRIINIVITRSNKPPFQTVMIKKNIISLIK